MYFAQAPAEGMAQASPAGKDAFAVLMQQARQEQCSSSGSAAERTQVQAPADALTFLMQQARGAQQSIASAPSVGRCECNLKSIVLIIASLPAMVHNPYLNLLFPFGC